MSSPSTICRSSTPETLQQARYIVDAHATIERHARDLHERGATVIGLGGDHSVALPLLRAAAASHGTLSLLQLDSHTDTWDSYFGGHKLTNGTIFRRAVEENLIDPQRSVQIGLRGGLYSAMTTETTATSDSRRCLRASWRTSESAARSR